MAALSAFVMAHPSYRIPGIILEQAQISGAIETLGGGGPMAKLGQGDLYVYATKMTMSAQTKVNAASSNRLPSASVAPRLISTPTYRLQTVSNIDGFAESDANNWGFSLTEGLRLAGQQSIAQTQRSMLLFGVFGSKGEGLLNTSGAATTTPPADAFGQITYQNYDPGTMVLVLTQAISKIRVRTNAIGGAPIRIVILAPQRFIDAMQTYQIVQLTNYQRPGAGSGTVATTLQEILNQNKVAEVTLEADDSLIGAGASGTDAILIVAPEIVVAKKPMGFDTNKFAELAPNLSACTLQLQDAAAPTEYATPVAYNSTARMQTQRMTSGWGIRGEGLNIISWASLI